MTALQADDASARRLTDRIKLLCGSVADQLGKLVALLADAQAADVHTALGYPSWPAYVAAEFGDDPLRLNREDRRQLVRSLSEAGMSTRAIAPVVGVDNATVHRDLSGVADATPEADASPAVVVGKVVGMDGKEYPRAEPQKRRRRPLPDGYRDTVRDLDKAVNRLRRLHEDDRFQAHRAALGEYHSINVGQALARLQDCAAELQQGQRPPDGAA